MRTLCLVAVLLALPLTATAQQSQRRGDDRRSSADSGWPNRGSEQRGQATSDKTPAPRAHSTNANDKTPPPPVNGAMGLGLPPIGLPPAKSTGMSPGKQPTPPWEQKQTPWWERQGPPPWERQQVPAWQTMNPARTLLDREKNQKVIVKGDRWHDRRPDIVYVLPPYRYFPTTLPGINEHYIAEPAPASPIVVGTVQTPVVPVGALRVEVEPRDLLQVFVDGVFVGAPADHGDAIELTPGVRHVELRARGYKPLAFDAEILADRLITYRGVLERDSAAEPSIPAPLVIAPPPAASGPTTMYVIPGCYLGNIEPKESDLKPGCSLRSMITIVR